MTPPQSMASGGVALAEQLPVMSGSDATAGTGAVWSSTVTACVQVEKLPETSVTFHVTVVTPTGNTAGASLEVVSRLPGVQLSVAVGIDRFTVASQPLADTTLMGSGQVTIVG